MITGIAAAGVAIIQSTSPIPGWTETDVLAALNDENLSNAAIDTADPNFPSVGARTADGFPVSIVRMACQETPPQPVTICGGAWVSIAIPVTEMPFALNILGSLEHQGRPPLGVNGSLSQMIDEGGETTPVFMLSTYLAADNGVHPRLIDHAVDELLIFADQTRNFLLSDDPAHTALWAGED